MKFAENQRKKVNVERSQRVKKQSKTEQNIST